MSNWLKNARRGRRRQAKNFTSELAQKRLDATIAPFHQQIENSLAVDSVNAVIFKRCDTGRPCTCKKIPIMDELDQSGNRPGEDPDLVPFGSQNDGITFEMAGDHDDDIFGEPGQSAVAQIGKNRSNTLREEQVKEFEAADILASGDAGYDIVEGDDGESIEAFEDTLFGGTTVNCGVCYSRGIVPAYNVLNHTHYVLTNYEILNSLSYNVDFSQKPALIEALSDDAYCHFKINVPKYFKEAKYSVRDNLDIFVDAFLYVDPDGNRRLTQAALNDARGKQIDVYVIGTSFTHVSVFFKQDADPIDINLSQEAETLDYMRSSTIGQLTAIAPAKIGMIRNSDLLVIPSRSYTMKVTDAPRNTTSERTIIQWELTCRVLQGSEALSNIYKGTKVR